MRTVALALLLLWAMAAYAQTTSAPPPPPMPPESKAAKPAPAPSTPRRAIELSPAERQAIDARELKKVKPASVEEALQPTPEDARIERDEANNTGGNTTRIEQYRTSNRISEVIVTPAGSSRSYSMTNREGKQPFGTTQMTPGLSVPNFFRFEFGRPPPTPTVPPPVALPPSAPSKPAS